jgi:hypothetical protein
MAFQCTDLNVFVRTVFNSYQEAMNAIDSSPAAFGVVENKTIHPHFLAT